MKLTVSWLKEHLDTNATVEEIADALIADFMTPYDDGGVDAIYGIYTRMESMLTQTPRARRLLPLEIVEGVHEPGEGEILPLYEFEPDPETVLDALLPMYVRSRVWFYLLQSAASQLASQQRAMKSATDNAKQLIERLTREANQARQAEITQEMVLRELAKIAGVDIKNYLSYRTEKTVVGTDEETGEPIVDYSHIVDLKDSEQVDGTLISEIQLQKGNLKFKLHDRVKALELLGKHLGMFVDRTRLENPDGSPLQVSFNISRPNRPKRNSKSDLEKQE